MRLDGDCLLAEIGPLRDLEPKLERHAGVRRRLGRSDAWALQVDLPRGVQSGLRDAERILKGVPGISFSYFTASDVVRHPLVAKIIHAYDADDEAAAARGDQDQPAGGYGSYPPRRDPWRRAPGEGAQG